MIVEQKTQSIESLLADVTDEFVLALRDGRTPQVDDYVDRYPQLAAVLRTVLPALAEIHGASGDDLVNQPSGDVAGILGDFRLIREVGRGGMGIVYEAEQISLGRRVALKVLPFASVLDDRQLARFKNEARAAATLHHTNIVPVFSVGCERGVHFYAMQFIEGHTLAELVNSMRASSFPSSAWERTGAEAPLPEPFSRDAQQSARDPAALTEDFPVAPHHSSLLAPHSLLDPQSSILPHPSATTLHAAATTIVTERSTNSPNFYRTIARLGIQAAEALQHAHQHGVLHRDIKPANLMLDAEGTLWITDFGLARLETDAGMTMTGDLVGTLRYMSPEQALGKRVTIDHRTDIYSLGVTLYELLAQRPPFDGENRAELLKQVAFEEPKLLRRHKNNIPRELETIVAKAIEKSPDHRYPTSQEMADDLRRFMDDKPIVARPPNWLVRSQKWTRRHRTTVKLVALFSVLALIGVGVAATMFWRQRAEFIAQQELSRDAELTNQRGLLALDRARNLARLGSYDDADIAYRDALDRLASLQGQFPGDLGFAADHLVARYHYRHFVMTHRPGRENEANEALQRLAVEAMSLDLTGGARNSRVAYFNLGRCCFQIGNQVAASGDVVTAADLFARARECFTRLAPDHQDAQARSLIELGKCLDRQRRWHEARSAYAQVPPLLDAWNSTFHRAPQAGAWRWTPYPDMLSGSGVDLYLVCNLLRAIVYQRLGEDVASQYYFERGANFRTFDDPPDEALQDLQLEAAALLNVQEQLPPEDDPRSQTTHTASLLKPAIDLLCHAEIVRGRGNDSAAYALFEQSFVEAQQANLDVRSNDVFQQAAKQFGPRGASRLAAHAHLRDSRRQAITEAMLNSDPGHTSAVTAQIEFTKALKLIESGQEQPARLAMQSSIAHSRAAIESDPKDHTRYVALAWSLVTAPILDLRDSHEAVRLAQKARELKSSSSSALVTLGAANYRLGQWADAVSCFGEVPDRSEVHKQSHWRPSFFFHAMAHWQLGNHERARSIFANVVRRTWRKPLPLQQLLRAEAEALMGIAPSQLQRPTLRPPEP